MALVKFGRADWLAGFITSIIGPNDSGKSSFIQAVSLVDAGGAPVEIAGTASATATESNVAASASSVQLLAANTARLPGSGIVNDSTAILYIRLGATAASATAYTFALDGKTTVPGWYPIPDGFTGAVQGIWASATGSARVTEIAA